MLSLRTPTRLNRKKNGSRSGIKVATESHQVNKEKSHEIESCNSTATAETFQSVFTGAPSRQTKRKSIGQEIERPHQAAGCIPPFDALRDQTGDLTILDSSLAAARPRKLVICFPVVPTAVLAGLANTLSLRKIAIRWS